MKTWHSITVEFDQLHDLGLRTPLVERLQRIDGVVSAVFDSGDSKVLTVTFRDNCLSSLTLLDFLTLKGMSATVLSDCPDGTTDKIGNTT